MFPERPKFVFLTGKCEFGKTMLTYATAATLADGGAECFENMRSGRNPAARLDPSTNGAI